MPETGRAPISLLEVLKKSTGFDGVLFTTYTAYLPFVEEVVLRRLRSNGCACAVVLMDGRELGGELRVRHRRPAFAGRRYGLLPVECGGVFHPKLALMVGPKRARILLGSHNLTLSGYLRNREITNQIDVEIPKDREGAAGVVEILSFCGAWAAGLPGALKDALEPLHALGRPYRGPAPDRWELKLVGSRPEGASLWDRVRPLLPDTAKRIAFLGPFYDGELAFVRRVMADLSPSKAVVGLDPSSAQFPGTLRRLPGALRVADVHDLDAGHDGHGYLHGKAVLIETRSERFLVSGSANPTAAAWLAPAGRRNAEIVAIRRLPQRGGDDLGLDALWDAPAVAPAALSKLRSRVEAPAVAAAAPLVGIRDGTGFRIAGLDKRVKNVEVWNAEQGAIPCRWSKKGGDLLVEVGESIDSASTFEISFESGCRAGFVHHGMLLREEAAPSSQKRLREALGGLGGDPTQLEELLRLVDRAIFEAPAAERPAGGRAVRTAWGAVEDEPARSTARVVASIEKGRRGAERHRLSTGDIGLLLDYLMRKLWRGLAHGPAAEARSELDLINAVDDDLPAHEFTDQEIAEAWTRKSRTLLRRLERRILESADAPQVVMETTAVLGVLEALRKVEEQDRWRSLRLEFVDREQADDFALAALPRLLQPGTGLLDAAKLEIDGAFLEENALLEWLGWLAWFTRMGPEEIWEIVDPKDVWEEDYETPTEIADWLARTCLVAARLVELDDQRVLRLLEGTPYPGLDPRTWLRTMRRLGEACVNPGGAARLTRRPALGDLVVTERGAGPYVVRLVRGENADLIDFSRKTELVAFKLSSLRVIDAGLERVRQAVG